MAEDIARRNARNTVRTRMIRQARKERGVCQDCGKEPRHGKLVRCRFCLDRHNDYKREKKERERAAKERKARPYAFIQTYEGLLEAPAPPAEKPVYIFNRRDRAEQLNHLRRTG